MIMSESGLSMGSVLLLHRVYTDNNAFPLGQNLTKCVVSGEGAGKQQRRECKQFNTPQAKMPEGVCGKHFKPVVLQCGSQAHSIRDILETGPLQPCPRSLELRLRLLPGVSEAPQEILMTAPGGTLPEICPWVGAPKSCIALKDPREGQSSKQVRSCLYLTSCQISSSEC